MLLRYLNPEIQISITKFRYRFRFLLTYTVIGFFSIVLELILFRAAKDFLAEIPNKMLSVMFGILFAFYFNSRFNFNIPDSKRKKAFLYFVGISLFSLSINTVFYSQFVLFGLPYEVARLSVAGPLFLFGYILHRKITFKEYKKVGVAIYANGIEDIKSIWDKISAFPDFIHVDIIDDTFADNTPDPKAYKLETIAAYWPRKIIHCHIMSKKPIKWIEQIYPHVTTILVHLEIEELHMVLQKIQSLKKKVGLVVSHDTQIVDCLKYIDIIDEIMLLAISNPGTSGQNFDNNTFEKINEINKWPNRSQFDVCVDGGVNNQIINMLNVEKVVSGSYVLNGKSPKTQVMKLQTSHRYE